MTAESGKGWTMHHGDCSVIEWPAADAIVTDPPYGIGEAAGKNVSRGNMATAVDYGDADWDDEPIAQSLVDRMLVHSRWQIIFGGNYYSMPPASCWLVWDKLNGANDFADCELAWTNMSRAVRRIAWRWNGMIREGKEPRFHPTQKPVGVMQWAIGWLPDGAKIILDPFAGSGTTGVAALRLGRRFVGIEKDEKYFRLACDRLRAEEQGSTLQAARAGQGALFK